MRLVTSLRDDCQVRSHFVDKHFRVSIVVVCEIFQFGQAKRVRPEANVVRRLWFNWGIGLPIVHGANARWTTQLSTRGRGCTTFLPMMLGHGTSDAVAYSFLVMESISICNVWAAEKQKTLFFKKIDEQQCSVSAKNG